MLKKLGLIMAIVMLFGTIFTLPVQAASVFSISGNVVVNGVPLKGVTVTVKGTTLKAVTNGLGNYRIASVPAGKTSSLVPTLTNYSFAPVSIPFTNLQASLTGQNFVATQIKPVLYSIAGVIKKGTTGMAGVTVTFATFTTTTATNGSYLISKIPVGTRGKIVPSKTGYAFTPTSITVSGITANLTKQNFTGVLAFTIGGKVTDQATGLPLGGVTVSLGTFSAVSNATTGAYTIRNVPAGTSGAVVASLAGYTFTPLSITVTKLAADLHSENFVAAP